MPWMKLIDMELDDEASLDYPSPIPGAEKPKYPYGLRICLTRSELEKLGLEPDCEVGDIIDLRAFAEVTSVSKTQMEGGEENWRVELQIQKLAVTNESDEMPDDEASEGA